MKQKSNSGTKTGRVWKARGPVQRDVKEVMAELMLRLSEKLEPQPEQESEGKGRVTAHYRLVYPRSIARWQHPSNPGPSRW